MNRAFTKALLSLLGAFLLQSGIANAQTGAGIGALGGNPSTSNSFVIKNTAGEKVTFGISSTGVTNYQLTYPSVVGGAGALLYSTNATGILGWLNAGTNGQVLTLSGGVPTWATPTYGTVTSVGLALPTEFNVTVSPITSSGNLTATWAVEAPNKVFAGPSSGVLSITPSFRSLVAADIPNLDASKITSGLLSSARGGTGIDGSTAANGKVLIGNGTGYSLANITAGNGISITNGSGAITIAATNTGVTSVGLAMPSIFSVTNSPVTSTGTLTASLVTQTAATFFAGPVTGSVAVPTFRPLSATDIPDLSGSYIVNGTSPQIPANFYISGNGTLCGQLQLRGTSTGLSTFQAGAQGTNNINYTLPITAPTANQVLVSSGGATSNLSWASVATGTVTSVGLTMPAVLYSSVGNSPITTSGVLTPVLATQTAATIFAGPATGGATTPTFRALAATDIPNLDASKITTGLLSSARGGTGIDGSSAANGKVLIGNGTGYSLANITAGNGISITNGSGAITIAATNTGVTSVGLAMPSIFSVTNSPVTSTGTLTAALTTQTAATFFAGPTSGSAVTPTFRPLAATDIPDLSGSYIVNGTSPQIPANFYISGNGSLCGQLRLRGTSTGLSTFQAGAQGTNNINYTLPITAPTANQVLISSGGSTSNLSWATVATGTVTSVALTMPTALFTTPVSGSAITTSGTLAPALATQTAATVFAGPVTGASTTPTFRALVASDIPSLASGYIVNSTSLQSSSNFYISGNGTMAGQLQLKGTSTGLTTFAAGAQGATNINYTLPTAQGASKTYLQNDGSGVLSWVDLGTQIGGIIFARKSSDETVTNSTALQNDNDLLFAIGANETWEIIVQMEVTSQNDDPKMKIAVTIPSGTLHAFVAGEEAEGSWIKTSGTSSGEIEVGDDDEENDVTIQGLVVGGSTGGTVHIQWAPNKSCGNAITVKTNSYIKATRVQ